MAGSIKRTEGYKGRLYGDKIVTHERQLVARWASQHCTVCEARDPLMQTYRLAVEGSKYVAIW